MMRFVVRFPLIEAELLMIGMFRILRHQPINSELSTVAIMSINKWINQIFEFNLNGVFG